MEQMFFPVTQKKAAQSGIGRSSEANKNALFPTQLRNLRKEKGVSQEELSKILGVSKSTLGLWETGDTLPDARSLHDLAVYYGVSADYLLGLSESKEICGTVSMVCNYTHLSSDAVKAIKEECDYTSSRIALSFILSNQSFLGSVTDFITSSVWENVNGKILGWCPPSKEDVDERQKQKNSDLFIVGSVPHDTPIFAPDAEVAESFCFAKTIKEMTKMYAEFKAIYENSSEFADILSADYVDAYMSSGNYEE